MATYGTDLQLFDAADENVSNIFDLVVIQDFFKTIII